MLKIRRYRPSDHSAVCKLHKEALESAGAFGEAGWDTDLDDIEQVYIRDGGEFLVGIYEGRVVAMGALKRTSSNGAEIKRMRVNPEFPRHGGFYFATWTQAYERTTDEYPSDVDYDLCRGKKGERPQADQNIKQVPLPERDPVYGSDGPLFEHWKT